MYLVITEILQNTRRFARRRRRRHRRYDNIPTFSSKTFNPHPAIPIHAFILRRVKNKIRLHIRAA